MPVTISITDDQIATAIKSFIGGICPAPFEVVQGQANRVPEPATPDFAIFTPTNRRRLATNEHGSADCRLIGSIAGTALTVTQVDIGAVAFPAVLWGQGIADGTIITAGPSNGGPGVYTVNNSQTVPSEMMACGAYAITEQVEVTLQIDVHGPASADNAQKISTLFRDDYGVSALGDSITPLYADDAQQIPFINAESQWEDRYVIRALLQINPIISVPQQYADAAVMGLINVDAAYPPT